MTDEIQVEIDGVSHTFKEWAEITGINVGTIKDRYYHFKSGTDLIAPVRKRVLLITINEETHTIKEWAASRTEQGKITVDMGKCNRTYTRFRTTFMDGVIPDAPGTKSGWNTTNHYFYEVVNRTGKSLFVQLALSSKEMPIEQQELSDRINEYYPTKFNKAD